MEESGKLWVLKFTEDGGVYVSEQPPSLAQYPVETTTTAFDSNKVLEVGDFVLAEGKRAHIRNLFLSACRGSLAQLFFIDTAEEKTLPLHHLMPLSDRLLEKPRLAQHYKLYGISPRVPDKERNASSHDSVTTRYPVGRRSTGYLLKLWPQYVMKRLKEAMNFHLHEDGDGDGDGDGGAIEVYCDIMPSNQITLLCSIPTTGKMNFNRYLVTIHFAVERSRSLQAVVRPTLPSPKQLMAALENIQMLGVDDETPRSRATKPVSKTSSRLVYDKPKTEEEEMAYVYYKVYVETAMETRPCVSLEMSGFPGSVCKLLTSLGFQTPTLVQATAWPILQQSHRSLTILVSPPNSGKTLAYLLPLVTRREVSHSGAGVPHPRVVVVATSTWNVEAIKACALQLMSAQSAHRRFRSCAAYKAQSKAVVQILNGVEVLVCTPRYLIHLIEETVVQLDHLAHLVLDDFKELQQNFSSEIFKILTLCSTSHVTGSVGVVVTTSKLSKEIEELPDMIRSHTSLCSSPSHLILACPIEATINCRVKINVIPCLQKNSRSQFLHRLPRAESQKVVICVADGETANIVWQQLSHLCFSVAMVTTDKERREIDSALRHSVVVVSDEVVSSLFKMETLVVHVVHYEWPADRTTFTNRLTLLYPAMHRGVGCSHTILLTEEWSKQAGLLKEMMERTNQPPPPPLLLDMAKTLEEERETKRRDFDICYKLKAWGSCCDPLCTYRHLHNTTPSSSFLSPRPLDIPKDGSIKVKVHHISTATRWWVSLQGHAPLYRGAEPVKPHNPDVLLNMSCDLAKYFTPERQRNTLQCVPPEGNYCALRDRDGCFYRVRILKFSQPLEFMFHHRERALVRLIDRGETRIVDVSQLLELPPHLLAPPPAVFEVFVCLVKPTDSDLDWPPQAAELMEQKYGNQTVHGGIVLVSDETVWLHPVELKIHLKVQNKVAAMPSPQQLLKEAQMGESNPKHLVNLSNCLGLPLVTTDSIVTIDDHCISFVSLKDNVGGHVEMCVSFVDSPNQFYLQPMATEDQVIEMENQLNQYGDVCSMIVQSLPVGSVCSAQFSGNRSWYRGCVLEVGRHESKIRFLDYGNVEWVMNHLVQPIHPSLLKLPFQAICTTFGLDDEEWGTEAGKLLYDWTRELVLIAEVKSITESSSKLLLGSELATVELYEKEESSSSDGVSDILGTNIALRLPRVQSAVMATADPHTAQPPGVNHDFESLCLSLSSDTALDDREAIAMAIRNAVFNKPGISVGADVLEHICQFLINQPPSVSMPLLQTLQLMSTYHSRVVIELSSNECVSMLLKMIQNTSDGGVLFVTVTILVGLLSNMSARGLTDDSTISSVLFTETTLDTLISVFGNHGNRVVESDSAVVVKETRGILIYILHCITSSSSELLQFAVTERHVVPLLCQWMRLVHSTTSSSTTTSSGYLRYVAHALLMLEGVARLPCQLKEVWQCLPFDIVDDYLLSSEEATLSVLKLMVTLSTVPEYAVQLSTSQLAKNILIKISSPSVISKVLLNSLQLNLEKFNKATIQSSEEEGGEGEVVHLVVKSSPTLSDEKTRGQVKKKKKVLKEVKRKQRSQIQKRSSQAMATLVHHPRVQWSQRVASVLLAVQLRDCCDQDTHTNFSKSSVTFKTKVLEQQYEFSIEVYASIKPEVCSVSYTGSEVLIKLVKDVEEVWPRLYHGNQKPVFLGIDFNRWEDADIGILGANMTKKWGLPTEPQSKTYLDPIVTDDSDLEDDESESEEKRSEDEEEEEDGQPIWEDDLDLGI